MNTKLEIAFFILIGVIVVLDAVWVFNTERRLKRFFLGKEAKDLEDTMIHLGEEIARLNSAKDRIEQELVTLNNKQRSSLRGLETIRFNPFQDQGSNQSFAIGLLSEEGNGVVISSLYSRERMSVFAKPIKGGKSDYELTNEEKEVLDRARV